ncbi:hypothetical protein CLOM_g21315 [Closterium sp. NIES-68]|nr:hypothetical protein CLOM_g21315 [Closterium sp. NIES-68]GJP63474.1 hypothetical protein CLOP_g20546 [Closterium sp. NIES-67]
MDADQSNREADASQANASQNGVEAVTDHSVGGGDDDAADVIVMVDPLRVKRVREMDVTGSEDHVLDPPEGERMLALLAQLDAARGRAALRKGARGQKNAAGGKGGRKRRSRGEEDGEVGEAHGEWAWQGVMSQLTSAQEELRVIVDLVNAVESGAEGLAVSGVSKPKQHAAEMSSDLTARLAGKHQLLQDVGGGLLHAAARLTQQVSDDAPFYTALQYIQHRWKVKRTHPALAAPPTPLSSSSSTAAGFAADVTVQSLLLSLPHSLPLPASMPVIPATSLPFTSLRLDRDKQGMLRAASPEGQPIRKLHVSLFGREANDDEVGEDGGGSGGGEGGEGGVEKEGRVEEESGDGGMKERESGGGMDEEKESEEEGDVGRAVRKAHQLLRAVQRSWFDWQLFESLQGDLTAATAVSLPLTSISSSSLSLSLASSPASLSLHLLSPPSPPALWSSLTQHTLNRRHYRLQLKGGKQQQQQGQGKGQLQQRHWHDREAFGKFMDRAESAAGRVYLGEAYLLLQQQAQERVRKLRWQLAGGGSGVGMGVGVVELLWGAAAHRAKRRAVERCLQRMVRFCPHLRLSSHTTLQPSIAAWTISFHSPPSSPVKYCDRVERGELGAGENIMGEVGEGRGAGDLAGGGGGGRREGEGEKKGGAEKGGGTAVAEGGGTAVAGGEGGGNTAGAAAAVEAAQGRAAEEPDEATAPGAKPPAVSPDDSLHGKVARDVGEGPNVGDSALGTADDTAATAGGSALRTAADASTAAGGALGTAAGVGQQLHGEKGSEGTERSKRVRNEEWRGGDAGESVWEVTVQQTDVELSIVVTGTARGGNNTLPRQFMPSHPMPSHPMVSNLKCSLPLSLPTVLPSLSDLSSLLLNHVASTCIAALLAHAHSLSLPASASPFSLSFSTTCHRSEPHQSTSSVTSIPSQDTGTCCLLAVPDSAASCVLWWMAPREQALAALEVRASAAETGGSASTGTEGARRQKDKLVEGSEVLLGALGVEQLRDIITRVALR